MTEPITLAQAKDHLRVVTPDEDSYISSLITAAREMAEGRLNRTIVQRQRVATFKGWNRGTGRYGPQFVLLKPPVISVDNVGYLDATTGTEVMLDSTAFYLPTLPEDEMPRMELGGTAAPLILPAVVPDRRDSVRVYYTAGYEPGKVPQPIIQWMLLAIGTMYDNRTMEVAGATVAPLPDDFSRWLLQPYMVYE